jgi:hypothetical protein
MRSGDTAAFGNSFVIEYNRSGANDFPEIRAASSVNGGPIGFLGIIQGAPTQIRIARTPAKPAAGVTIPGRARIRSPPSWVSRAAGWSGVRTSSPPVFRRLHRLLRPHPRRAGTGSPRFSRSSHVVRVLPTTTLPAENVLARPDNDVFDPIGTLRWMNW